MENKKVLLFWLLSFGACNTVAKQNISSEDFHAVVAAAARVAVVRASLPVFHNCAKGVVGAANAIAGFADRVASAAAEVARATDR